MKMKNQTKIKPLELVKMVLEMRNSLSSDDFNNWINGEFLIKLTDLEKELNS